MDIPSGIAAVEQLLCDHGVGRYVLKLGGKHRHSIKVRAQADMFNPRHIHDVVDVVDDVVDASWKDGVAGPPPGHGGTIVGLKRVFAAEISHDVEHVLSPSGRFRVNKTGKEIHHHNATIGR